MVVMRVGSPVIRSCWQADLQADQSPGFILYLGGLTLQAVTSTPTPTSLTTAFFGLWQPEVASYDPHHLILTKAT